MDRHNRDVHRITGQSFIGAQPPLGEIGRVLWIDITRFNASELEHFSTQSIGIERTANSARTAVDIVDQVVLVSYNPGFVAMAQRHRHYHHAVWDNISMSLGNISFLFNPSYETLFSSFQSAQGMLCQA